MATKHILVIDDEPALSFMVETVLRKLGNWTVVTASSGLEGLQKAESERPDGILLDVMLPDMDGLTILKKLQAAPTIRSIPVILLTAKVQPSDYARYAQLEGLSGVIAKPFAPLELPDQIAKLFNW